jgi:hypothetical protein
MVVTGDMVLRILNHAPVEDHRIEQQIASVYDELSGPRTDCDRADTAEITDDTNDRRGEL